MPETITKLRTIEEALKHLENEYPHGVDLIYIDYRDSFSDNLKDLNTAIQANDLHSIHDENGDWMWEAQTESIDYILKEQFTEEELELWDTDERNELEQWLQGHDTSDPTKQLLKNTNNQLFFYDTGLEIPEYPSSGNGDTFLRQQGKRIAKKLKINYENNAKDLRSLIANAYYGGQLVLIFYTQPSEMFSPNKDNIIRFKKSHLCIMDRTQGSGDIEEINEIVVLPFNRQNLWIDKAAPGYSINEVFGLYQPAFDYTPDLLKISKTRTPKTTPLQNEVTKYQAWDKLVKEGKCAFSDPRYKSHDTEYIMSFPMGNKCKRCGRFYID